MSVEWFTKLKEIDSLNKSRLTHLNAKKEQEDRISKLLEKKNQALHELDEFKQEHLSLQQALFETEKKLKTAEEQKQRLIDLGGDDLKIKNFQAEATRLEEEGLDLLEKSELNSEEMKSKKQFLEGIEKTINEIELEAKEEINKLQGEIDNINLRLSLLQKELPEDFNQLLTRVQNKNLAHGPFTRIEAGSCYFCRYKISRVEESEIDMQKSLKTCPQCERIFLPYGS